MYRVKCEKCRLSFQNRKWAPGNKAFPKHNEEKEKVNCKIMSNMVHKMCLGIFDKEKDEMNPFMKLHGDECWNKSGQTSTDQPTDRHNTLTSIVMGALSMAGCYWTGTKWRLCW